MAKKQLPVLAAKSVGPNSTEGEDRPPWHWIGFGTVAIFTTWLPGSFLAGLATQAIAKRFAGEPGTLVPPSIRALLALPQFFVAFLAAFLGGYLVTRFGGPSPGTQGTTPRVALLAGIAATLFASALAAPGVGYSPLVLLVGLALVPGAYLGGRKGVPHRTHVA